MPKSADLADLIALLGEAGALSLVQTRGGTRVHVPTRDHTAKSWMREILDDGAIAKFAEAFGGLLIDVPLAREWRVQLLLKRGGKSHAEIARECGTTERHVQRLSRIDWTPMPHGYNGLRGKDSASNKQLLLPLL